MTVEAFSEAWAQAWCDALNSNETYRTAAVTWEGAVGLVMTGADGHPASGRSVYLDLWHGECRSARVAVPGDLESAVYVIEAPESTWRQLLGGQASPIMALMSGKLRLTKGSMAELLPFVHAAKELVTVALGIETVFTASAS